MGKFHLELACCNVNHTAASEGIARSDFRFEFPVIRRREMSNLRKNLYIINLGLFALSNSLEISRGTEELCAGRFYATGIVELLNRIQNTAPWNELPVIPFSRSSGSCQSFHKVSVHNRHIPSIDVFTVIIITKIRTKNEIISDQ